MPRLRRNGDDDREAEESLLRPHERGGSGTYGMARRRHSRTHFMIAFVGGALLIVGILFNWGPHGRQTHSGSCDDFRTGYECDTRISRSWGQYSPWFQVESDIKRDLPEGCEITFAQVLARHGARYPTTSKSEAYKDVIDNIQGNVKSYSGKYTFLKDFKYTLGANDLTLFGQQQVVNLGIQFYHRYRGLARRHGVFVRAGSSERVVASAFNFTDGFYSTKADDDGAVGSTPASPNILVLPEESGYNCTLGHGGCSAFEDDRYGDSGVAKSIWANIFIPPIRERINKDLFGRDLLMTIEIIYLMDMCPFETVANADGQPSPFCNLFTKKEWTQYDHYQSLGKFYSYGSGNALGPTQGVGFGNELIARMTSSPVDDHTTVNHTLDDNPETFPVGASHPLFADFSHDTEMTSIFFALGLYNDTALLTNTSVPTMKETDGYSSAWTVPFAARAYFEKMKCAGQEEELVRVLVGDRVIPLKNCGADSFGRCTLSSWVESLSFVRGGGLWNRCSTS